MTVATLRPFVPALMLALFACGKVNPDAFSVCGDEVIDPDEQCEGDTPTACSDLGFGDGTAFCNPAQCAFDTSTCSGPVCGDAIIVGEEECDGANLNGQSCESLGFDGGTLACNDSCELDTSGCTTTDAVTVEVLVNEVPAPNIQIAIASANGDTVLETLATGADGRAITSTSNPVIVTAAFTNPNTGQRFTRSILGVVPGDLIRIRFAELTNTPITQTGRISTLIQAAPLAGATTNSVATGAIEASASALSTTPFVQNVFSFNTDTDGTGERLAQQFDGQGVLLGYHFSDNILLTPNATTDANVPAWNTALANVPCTLSAAPANLGGVEFFYSFRIGNVISGRPFADFVADPAPGSTVTQGTLIPNDAAVTSASCAIRIGEGVACSESSSLPAAFDFAGSQFTSPIFVATIDPSDQSRPRITWTEGTPGATADATIGTILYIRDGSGQVSTVVGDGAQTSLQIPACPADAAWAPYCVDDQTLQPSSHSVTKFDQEGLAGYDAVKAGAPGAGYTCASSAFVGN